MNKILQQPSIKRDLKYRQHKRQFWTETNSNKSSVRMMMKFNGDLGWICALTVNSSIDCHFENEIPTFKINFIDVIPFEKVNSIYGLTLMDLIHYKSLEKSLQLS